MMMDVQVLPGLATSVNFTLFRGPASMVQHIKWLADDRRVDRNGIVQPEIGLVLFIIK